MKGKEKNVKWSLRVKKIDLIGVFDIALFNTLIGKKNKGWFTAHKDTRNNFYIHSTRQLYFITLAWAPILSKVSKNTQYYNNWGSPMTHNLFCKLNIFTHF